MLIINTMAFWKLFQKCVINLGSLSDTMDTGTPYSRTISQIYNRHNSSNMKVIHTARKCVDFVSRSTITHTASCLYGVRGKCVTKSIVTCSRSHFHSATCCRPNDIYIYIQIYDTITKGVTRVSSNSTKNLLTNMLCIFKLLIPLLEDQKLLPDDGTKNLI